MLVNFLISFHQISCVLILFCSILVQVACQSKFPSVEVTRKSNEPPGWPSDVPRHSLSRQLPFPAPSFLGAQWISWIFHKISRTKGQHGSGKGSVQKNHWEIDISTEILQSFYRNWEIDIAFFRGKSCRTYCSTGIFQWVSLWRTTILQCKKWASTYIYITIYILLYIIIDIIVALHRHMIVYLCDYAYGCLCTRSIRLFLIYISVTCSNLYVQKHESNLPKKTTTRAY